MITNNQPIRWGILACGGIAEKFADDLTQHVRGGILASVASRDLTKAQAFAAKYGPEVQAFGSYEAMIQSGTVDVIYIASPHGLHHEHTLLCLNADIPVLCEKAFAINAGQVQDMIQTAKQKQVYLMEALWTRFHPSIAQVQRILASGRLGEIKHLMADFGFKAQYDPQARWLNPALTGGSLLDIGIYPLFISKLVLGHPQTLKATAVFSDTGVDMNCAMAASYASGATATLFSTFAAKTDTTCTIYGTHGKLEMFSRFHETFGLRITEYQEDGTDLVETIATERLGWGYSYEAEAVQADLRAGRLENEWMSHRFSMELMTLLDEIRAQIGLVYPQEK